jgi:DNA repair protein RadC
MSGGVRAAGRFDPRIARIALAPAVQGPGAMERERPRERMIEYGAERLGTDELVALVLGVGTRGRPALAVARELLAGTGGLNGLSRAAARELVGVTGIGAARAVRLAAAFDLGRRALELDGGGAPLRTAEQVFHRLRPRLTGLSQELFMVLALDVRNHVIAEIEVARGCLTGVDVHPREVFRPLIRAAAAAAVVAHNHPSGDPTPSQDDLMLTESLRAAGDLLGIPILDHVVLGGSAYISIMEQLGI